jgi:hypothetical protein
MRFFDIKDFIDASDRALAANLPSGLEVLTLQEVMKDLEEFESATKLLYLMVFWKITSVCTILFQLKETLCILLHLKMESLKFNWSKWMIF